MQKPPHFEGFSDAPVVHQFSHWITSCCAPVHASEVERWTSGVNYKSLNYMTCFKCDSEMPRSRAKDALRHFCKRTVGLVILYIPYISYCIIVKTLKGTKIKQQHIAEVVGDQFSISCLQKSIICFKVETGVGMFIYS